MPRQQGELPRHAAPRAHLKPSVLGAASVPSPGFSRLASKALTSSSYNGEVSLHVPRSAGNRHEITKLILTNSSSA